MVARGRFVYLALPLHSPRTPARTIGDSGLVIGVMNDEHAMNFARLRSHGTLAPSPPNLLS